jgi:DNA-binding LacI/PurR family transcriptional regulator
MPGRRKGPPRATPTLQQVARVAGVSIATASRVVTGAVPVSPDRKIRVEQAIALLGYVPDERARDLRRNAQKTVGLVIPSFASPLHGSVFRLLHRHLAAVGFTLLVYETGGDPAAEQGAVESLIRGHARAIAVAAATGLAPDVMAVLRRRDIRVVFFDDRPPEPTATSICSDDRGGARLLTDHLIELGHRRIGLVSGALAGSSGVDRHAGYIEALRAADIPVVQDLVRGFGWTIEVGHQAADELLKLANPPTAILATHPVLAAGVVLAARARGLRIPDDLSLASYFESDHIRYLDPPITALTGVPEAIADALIDALLDGATPGRHDVSSVAAFRSSTAPPRS